MGWWDVIQELRTGKADNKKVAIALAGLGALFMFSVIMILVGPLKQPSPIFQANFKSIMLAQFITGVFFLLSGAGIHRQAKWGIILGQLMIVIAMLWFIATPIWFFAKSNPNEHVMIPTILFLVSGLIFYGPIAYWGIRYLGRLEVSSINSVPEFTTYESISKTTEGLQTPKTETVEKYHSSPFPFGVTITFMLLLIGFIIVMGIFVRFLEDQFQPFVVMPLIASFFAFIALYNMHPSKFEKEHELIFHFFGGGSMEWFQGSWPFFKFLVYKDGLEIRVFFHCYFIPYDKMEDLSKKLGFFSMGILIKSDLPEVPARIRVASFSSKKVLALVNEQRDKYLAEKAKSATINP